MQKHKIATVLLVICLGLAPAVWSESKLVPAGTVREADSLWTASGAGKKAADTSLPGKPAVFTQTGRGSYQLALKMPETPNFILSGELKLPAERAAVTLRVGRAGSRERGASEGVRIWLLKDGKLRCGP